MYVLHVQGNLELIAGKHEWDSTLELELLGFWQVKSVASSAAHFSKIPVFTGPGGMF